MPWWCYVIVFVVVLAVMAPPTPEERKRTDKYYRDRNDEELGIRRDAGGKIIQTRTRPPP